MQEMRKPRIFISYRREGGFKTALWLHDQLESRGYDVFLDMICLGGGAFDENLLKEISQRDVLLVVLNQGCLKRRYFREDWVRKELAHAFQSGLKVIPLMEDGFKFPRNLPADIAHLPLQNGLEINLVMAQPWLDVLENKYILSEPQKPITYPPLPTVCPWQKYIAGALAAAALAGCLFFGIGSCTGVQPTDPTTTPTTAPTTVPTTAPTTEPTTAPTTEPTTAPTEPPISEVQVLGNSTGNLCNDGPCEVQGRYLTGNRVHYHNRLGDWIYWYDDSGECVIVKSKDESESKTLVKIPGLRYLLVTTDWFYYTTAENNAATLYRARRWAADQMGEPEAIASKFSANNDVMIDGNAAYYWRTEKGLFRLDLATGVETRILEQENIWSVNSFGISGDWVYLNTDTLISRVHLTTGEVKNLIDIWARCGDGELVACNVDNDWVYFAVTDPGKDDIDHNDRVFRIHKNGTDLEQIYVAERPDCRISYIGLQDGQYPYDPEVGFNAKYVLVAYSCASGRNIVEILPGTYNIYDHTHTTAATETLGIHVGSNQTNLANGGFVTYMPTQGEWTYASNAGEAYLNRFDANGGTTYCYDGRKRAVILKWTEDSKLQTKTLLEKVTCRYLFVTPDWFYCVLEEDGVNTLYRAENNPENHTIGELKKVVSGFLMQENNIVIQDGHVYYWVDGDGFYRARTDGSDVTKLWNQAISGWHTFHVTEEKVYYWIRGYGLYSTSLQNGSWEQFFDTQAISAKVNGTVEKDGKFYCIVQYKTEGERTRPDEIWCFDPTITEEGKEKASLVCAMPDVSMAVTGINRTGSILILQVKQDESSDSYQVYSLSVTTGELKHWKDIN